GTVHALAIDAVNTNTIYAGTCPPSLGRDLFKSTDGGSHWSAIGQLDSGSFLSCITALAVDPTNPARLIAGATAIGSFSAVFESTDAGAHWWEVGGGVSRFVGGL